MNVLHKYTRKSLLGSRTRTAVTIVGIILSVAMLTAVTTLISSVQQFMIDCIIAVEGGWYCESIGIPAETADSAAADSRTEWAAELECIGYATFEESENPGKPYLYLAGMREGFAEHMPIRLTEGRLPENSGELLLPAHLFEQTRFTAAVGDTITLPVCDRLSEDGVPLWQFDPVSLDENDNAPFEKTVKRESRTFTVVGFYARPSCEPYTAPGYTCLTAADGSAGTVDAWFRLHDPNDTYDFICDHTYSYGCSTNTELLRMTGSSGESAYNSVLYALGTIFVVIILFASVFLIYNAFSISISERTRQFGLLSSVGATRRQLSGCVLYEAFVLSCIGVPLGVLSGIGGIGVTLAATSKMFTSILAASYQSGARMRLHVSWEAVVIAAVLGLVTVLFSAWIPALRLRRLTAIEAIRQTADVKIRPRAVRTSRLTYKLYGFEGVLAAKNFKRARRKYRVTVFSLSVSLVLFVSASSFCTYLSDSARDVLTSYSFDIVYQYDGGTLDGARAIHQRLAAVDGVEQAALNGASYAGAAIPSSAFRSDFLRDSFNNPDAEAQEMSVAVVFCDDEVYAGYVEKLGLGPEYLRGDRLIAVNLLRQYNQEEGRYYVYTPLNGPTALRLDGRGAEIGFLTEEYPFGADLMQGHLVLLCPASAVDYLGLEETPNVYSCFAAPDHKDVTERMNKILREDEQETYLLSDYAESASSVRSLLTIVKVFSYGFITLISLIALANVFNTISTNVQLRRREFATLLSVGMTNRSFRRMMNYECLLYGIKGLMYGLPVSFLTTWLIHSSINNGLVSRFYMPWGGVIIAVVSVFLVVFVTMLYAMRKLKKCNLIETMKED